MNKYPLFLLFLLVLAPGSWLRGSGEISLSIDRETVETYWPVTLEVLKKALSQQETIYYGGSTEKYHLFFVDRTSLEGDMPWVFYEKWRMERGFLHIPNLRLLDLSGKNPLYLSPNLHPRLDKIESQPVLLLRSD